MRTASDISQNHKNLHDMGMPHDCDEFDRAEMEALNREWLETVMIKWPFCLGWNYPNKWN